MSARLAELRPLVDEHARLSAALQALGDGDSRARLPPAPSPSPAPLARSRSRTPKQTSATARKRARPGGQSYRCACEPLRIHRAPRAQSWPPSPACRPAPCTRWWRACSTAVSCTKKRCPPVEPDTHLVRRSLARQSAQRRTSATWRRRSRSRELTAPASAFEEPSPAPWRTALEVDRRSVIARSRHREAA